jgi:hypothetical protein
MDANQLKMSVILSEAKDPAAREPADVALDSSLRSE